MLRILFDFFIRFLFVKQILAIGKRSLNVKQLPPLFLPQRATSSQQSNQVKTEIKAKFEVSA